MYMVNKNLVLDLVVWSFTCYFIFYILFMRIAMKYYTTQNRPFLYMCAIIKEITYLLYVMYLLNVYKRQIEELVDTCFKSELIVFKYKHRSADILEKLK